MKMKKIGVNIFKKASTNVDETFEMLKRYENKCLATLVVDRNERGDEMANRIICSFGIAFLLHIVALFILSGIDGGFGTNIINMRWLTTLIGWSIFFFAFFVIMRPKKKVQEDSQLKNG